MYLHTSIMGKSFNIYIYHDNHGRFASIYYEYSARKLYLTFSNHDIGKVTKIIQIPISIKKANEIINLVYEK